MMYIDTDKLPELLEKQYSLISNTYMPASLHLAFAKALIDEYAKEHGIDIVRCEHCRRATPMDCDGFYHCHLHCATRNTGQFCSDGLRRTD